MGLNSHSSYYITFVRHGQTEENARNAFIGITDGELNEIGQKQAKATARYLKDQGWQFDLVLSSPLKRCLQTANIITEYLNLSFEIEPNLIERNYGIFENKTRQEVVTAYPHIFADYKKNKPFIELPEGESAIAIENRIHELFWQKIPQFYPKVEHILCITHLNPVRAFLRLTQLKPWEIYFEKFSNASVTRVKSDLVHSELLVYDFSCFEDPACNLKESDFDINELK